ncbi:MAG: TIGR03545 family protein, partial [Proteobacteria bacterium]
EVLSGVDPKEQLNNIKADLKAVARAEGLEKELKAKKVEWQKRIAELPKPKEVKELEAKVKALNFKGNPLQIAQNVGQARDIIKEARAKIQKVDESQKSLVSDINTYTAAVAELEKMVENDVADLQKRLKLPSIDPKEFSTQLFLSQVEGKLVSVRKYVEVARKYMPPKKTAAEKAAEKAEQLVPPARGQGRNYTFPITTGYPLFWLKQAMISSEITQSEWAGKVKGEIRNVTTNPSQLGVPLTARIQGDFPKQGVLGFDLLGTMDHTTDNPRESVKVQVAAFPLNEMLFSDSPKVRFGLKQATGASTLEATLAGDGVKLSFDGKFSKPEFILEAKNPVVQDVLKSVLNGIPAITLGANVGGTWSNFNFDINSNLGQELSAGFQKQLSAKLGDVKAKLRATVEERMGGAKERVQAALQDLIKGPGNVLKENREAMEKSVSDAEGSAKPAGGKAGGLLKGFGF